MPLSVRSIAVPPFADAAVAGLPQPWRIEVQGPDVTKRRLACEGGTILAVGAPLLVATSAVPDSVLHNQLIAVLGWGVWLGLCGPSDAHRTLSDRLNQLLVSLCLALLAGASWIGGQFGASLVICAGLAIAGLASTVTASQAVAFAGAFWLVGICSAIIALIQYFAPSMADGWFIAINSSPGRAVGNVRQPNHLATALICAIVWSAWLLQTKRLHARWAVVSIAAMVFAVTLSASRTGALSLGVLVVWGAVDRALPRPARWTLAITPLIYLLVWAGLTAFSSLDQTRFYGAERLQADGDISSSRFAIWRNALALIAMHPWTGVGWGNFNFAWTFTPFPDRPVAFFDHTHNAVLQLAVELGLPATAAVLGLLGWALWRARGAWAAGAQGAQHPARAALAMLAVLAVHSLLEYPLWYAYFLLPAAWALGMFLGSAPAFATRGSAHSSALGGAGALAFRLAGTLAIVGAAYAAWDHRRIEAIFVPPPDAPPLKARIAEGRKSWLFGHHADYAAVTAEPRDVHLERFRRPLHQLVDVRLLIAYIEALRANGRDTEALYAAQRLREFRRPDAQAYFKDCTAENPAPPFQCERGPVALTWRDLEP